MPQFSTVEGETTVAGPLNGPPGVPDATRIRVWVPEGPILDVTDVCGLVASINADRTITYGDAYKPTTSAKAWWKALAAAAPSHEDGPGPIQLDTRLGPVLSVPGPDGWIAVLHLDRSLVTSDDFDPDRAARIFWQRLTSN